MRRMWSLIVNCTICLQAADRALSVVLGAHNELRVKMLSNAPASVYSYKFSANLRQASGKDGAHIFFYKAQLMAANIDAAQFDKNITADYLWLTRQEFAQLMRKEHQLKYWRAIDRCLLFENVDKEFVSRTLNRLRSRIVKNDSLRETVAVK